MLKKAILSYEYTHCILRSMEDDVQKSDKFIILCRTVRKKSFNYANFKKIRVTCKTQQECCPVDVNFVPLV